jgi:hypothetical protein
MRMAAAALEFEAHESPPTKRDGETMHTQTSQNRQSARAERMQDFLMLSSFGFWTMLLGFAPVFAIHSLVGS